MNTDDSMPDLPPDVEFHLDHLLELWSQRQQLTMDRPELFLHTAKGVSGEFSREWWWIFWARVDRVLTTIAPGARPGGTGFSRRDQRHVIDGQMQPASPKDYRPYLRIS